MRIKFLAPASFLLFFFSTSPAQPRTDSIFARLLESDTGIVKKVLSENEKYEVQIIYTLVNRDRLNRPSFLTYHYQTDDSRYFNPASMVKLPVAALALEKINELQRDSFPRLTRSSCMLTDSAYKAQVRIRYDSTAEHGCPTVAHYIKKMLLVSDNDAYSRLYEFIGQETLNKKLWDKGYPNARIIQRFNARNDTLANRYTNPVCFTDSLGDTMCLRPMQYNPQQLMNPLGKIKKGYSLQKKGKKRVKVPGDFTYANTLCLQDITDILISLIFPDAVKSEKKFLLHEEDYRFLHRYLSMYPRESDFPKYNPKIYHDSYKKYLLYGAAETSITNPGLRIFNIVGQTYGYLSDVAYVADFDKHIEFFLSAVIYVNEDNVFDGKYEYHQIGFPFLARLGQLIYEYDQKRPRSFIPDLEKTRETLKGN